MIYFLIFIFIEVMISSQFIAMLGGLMTFMEFVVSFVVGVYILQNFKYSAVDKIKQIKEGKLSQDEFIKGSIGSGIGALLLIMPGFFTDIIGVVLQFSISTYIFKPFFSFKENRTHRSYQSNFRYNETNLNKRKNDEIIDVEVIDDTKHIVS